MRKHPRSLLLTATAFASAAGALAAPPADTQARLDALAQGKSGGVAVAWVDSEGVVFFSAGTFSADDPRPIGPDTVFEIGSMTKGFTALLLAESERAGKVSRHDPVAKHLLPPEDPAQAALAKITLRSLTTHTSGLPRLPFNLGPNPDGNPDPYANYDRPALLAALREHGPVAPVGKTVAYSNFGVALLGEALASAWGTSYADALQTRVLTPLGLKHTTLALAATPAPAELAPGHAAGSKTGNWTFRSFAPAGALRSSARDLALFLQAAIGGAGSPLHLAFAETTQAQRPVEDMGGEIGLGWFLTSGGERPVAWHNGATAGYRSFGGFSRAGRKGVVVLTNCGANVDALGFALLGVTPPRPASMVVKDAAAYLGRYPLSPAFALDITEQRGALFAQATGQPRLPLRPTASDRFATVGVAAEISFERDSAGKIIALTLHQNGRDQRAPRHNLPPPPKEIALPAATLAEYAGRYPIAPSFSITVTVENGAVFAQATGQGKNGIFATARDEFFYKVVDARISFTRDSTGKVEGLVLHQAGRDMPAKKAE